MIEYVPKKLVVPGRLIDVPTAWGPCEMVIADIIDQFALPSRTALEFGVDYGYSTAVLANYFDRVIGVDTFMGDINAGDRGESGIFKQVKGSMKDFPNVTLVPQSFQLWTAIVDQTNSPAPKFDLCHVDIVHDYNSTYNCGAWAVEHSSVTIFHDTIAFADVMRAVEDLSKNYGLNFYQWPVKHGLGILTRRTVRE